MVSSKNSNSAVLRGRNLRISNATLNAAQHGLAGIGSTTISRSVDEVDFEQVPVPLSNRMKTISALGPHEKGIESSGNGPDYSPMRT